MEKFEYTTITVTIDEKFLGPSELSKSFLNDVNKLGSEGWEMVGIVPLAMGMGRTISAIATFKRKIQ